MSKPKNKYIAFHGGNEQAVQVYRDLKRIAHERDLFIWQVIRDGLEALAERDAVEQAMQACMDALPNLETAQNERNKFTFKVGDRLRCLYGNSGNKFFSEFLDMNPIVSGVVKGRPYDLLKFEGSDDVWNANDFEIYETSQNKTE